MKKSIFACLGLLSICGVAAAATEATYELDSFTRKEVQKPQGNGMFWASANPLTINLKVKPVAPLSVVDVEVENLSMKDATGKDLKGSCRANDFGISEQDAGSLMLILNTEEAPQGAWVEVQGCMQVSLSSELKTQAAQKVSKGAPVTTDFAGGTVTYSIDEAGDLEIELKGKDVVDKVADFAFTTADGKELEPNGHSTMSAGSMSHNTYSFEEPLNELSVAIQTYEGKKTATLPLNFRLNMGGIIAGDENTPAADSGKKADDTPKESKPKSGKKSSKKKSTTKRKKS